MERPTKPGEWQIERIIEALSRKLPSAMLESKLVDGKKVFFIPWSNIPSILDKYAPGWTWEIVSLVTTQEILFLTGRLSIPTANGIVHREAAGCEKLSVIGMKGYGDPSSNASAMALRRAVALFGLGLYLYKI